MKANRFWIEIIALGTAIAFAIALLIATLGAAAATVGAQEESSQAAPAVKSYQGMVTCSRCRAKHSAALGRTATNCVLVCVQSGASFALIDGDNVHQLEGDASLLKKFAGQRAQITGTAHGNTIEVSSVAAMI